VKITADTNVLVRALTGDDPRQSPLAKAELAEADLVVLALPALCELVWVLASAYRQPLAKIAAGLRSLVSSANVAVDRPAVEVGLRFLEAGADFADGVISHQGAWLGGDEFVSFDRRAVRVLIERGERARLLA
jgi:predicted nucleic-acid-binding protein